MGKNIRSSSSPKALAASFPVPTLADAMDEVRLSVDRFCLLAGVRHFRFVDAKVLGHDLLDALCDVVAHHPSLE
jgi:hypothetical protein